MKTLAVSVALIFAFAAPSISKAQSTSDNSGDQSQSTPSSASNHYNNADQQIAFAAFQFMESLFNRISSLSLGDLDNPKIDELIKKVEAADTSEEKFTIVVNAINTEIETLSTIRFGLFASYYLIVNPDAYQNGLTLAKSYIADAYFGFDDLVFFDTPAVNSDIKQIRLLLAEAYYKLP